MKKILLVLLLVVTHTNTFSQEGNKEINTKFHRFGMTILSVGYGYGGSVSPLSFYVANDLNQIISFGFDVGIGLDSTGYQLGVHVGFGKMKATSYNPNLYLGYLIEFSTGYSSFSMSSLIPRAYIGFSPNFILEIDQFLFRTGLYVDTSLVVNITVGIGFLLK